MLKGDLTNVQIRNLYPQYEGKMWTRPLKELLHDVHLNQRKSYLRKVKRQLRNSGNTSHPLLNRGAGRPKKSEDSQSLRHAYENGRMGRKGKKDDVPMSHMSTLSQSIPIQMASVLSPSPFNPASFQFPEQLSQLIQEQVQKAMMMAMNMGMNRMGMNGMSMNGMNMNGMGMNGGLSSISTQGNIPNTNPRMAQGGNGVIESASGNRHQSYRYLLTAGHSQVRTELVDGNVAKAAALKQYSSLGSMTDLQECNGKPEAEIPNFQFPQQYDASQSQASTPICATYNPLTLGCILVH